MSSHTLTSPDGPVIVSERSLRALVAIRREKLLPAMYGSVGIGIAQSNLDALADVLRDPPEWLHVFRDQPEAQLPERCHTATSSEATTLRLAISIPASLVMIEGAIKERAKLSFIKCEGVLSFLVAAHRQDHLSAVKPMVKALQSLGFQDVLPDDVQLQALYDALDKLG